jgi:phosphoglycolate phosphatase-like HAD superfamily hydrolase
MHCHLLFLDFDGVVVDSMGAKTEAFVTAMEPFGFDSQRVGALYRSLAGVGRRMIFDLVYNLLSGRTIDEGARAEVAERFAALEQGTTEEIRLFDGVDGFLKRQACQRPLVLVTGTPAELIDGLLTGLEIDSCFDAAYSTSGGNSKDALMTAELEARGLDRGDALFVGDSHADMSAAARVPLRFVAIGDTAFFSEGDPHLVLPSLVDLEPHLDPAEPARERRGA